ncbi:MAG: hypothetical protein IJ725_05895 [Ruminococcus sp.]|nr:hypothetical protein [Ruminococcus sp.]
MNKICKEYLSDAKKFFPIMGKNERRYLRGIVSELEDCIERENITTKQELYTKYHQPYDLASDYYNRFETDEIVKKIKISKYIKAVIVTFIVIILLITSLFCVIKYQDAKVLMEQEMVYSDEDITKDSNRLEDRTIYDINRSENFITDDEIIDNEEIIE